MTPAEDSAGRCREMSAYHLGTDLIGRLETMVDSVKSQGMALAAAADEIEALRRQLPTSAEVAALRHASRWLVNRTHAAALARLLERAKK